LKNGLVGYGKSYASFGEIVQGRLSSGDDFLVTLPIDMWSTCEVVSVPHEGPSVVEGSVLPKSRLVAEQMLRVLGMEQGQKITIDLTRNIPIGKGLSSSTADMLAVVRGFQEVFGVIVTESFISRLFGAIEPHDGLHYYQSVAYNHRQGNLLSKLNYIPDFKIVAIDGGGEVSTLEYNRKLRFSAEDLAAYDSLYNAVLIAFAMRDDEAIAKCAHRSAILHVERTGNRLLGDVVKLSANVGALGVLATHSGTCPGLLFKGSTPDRELDEVEARAAEFGSVFRTKSLRLLL
jgi:L-threonine kinase